MKHIIKADFTFTPQDGFDCPMCGISAFPHKHKAGTAPGDFERIDSKAVSCGKECDTDVKLPHHLGIHSKDTWPEVFIGPEATAYNAGREETIEECIKLIESFQNDRIKDQSGLDVACWSPVTLSYVIGRLEKLKSNNPTK